MPSKHSHNFERVTAKPIRGRAEELAKYLNSQPCPECEGTRLRIEARHVQKSAINRFMKSAAWP